MVRVKVFATLVEVTGQRRLMVEGVGTVGELLKVLYAKFPGFRKELERGYIILVNGHNIVHLNGLDTPLNEEDTVSIFPPLGGG